MNAEQYLERIENKRLNSKPLYSRKEMIYFAEKYAKQLTLPFFVKQIDQHCEFNEEEFNSKTVDVEKAADYYAHNYFNMHETNSYKEQILMIAEDLNKGEITTEYAQTILLRLFNVIVTFCDNINCDKGILTDYYGDKSYCQECGSKQNEH